MVDNDPTDNDLRIDPNVIASLCYDSYNRLGKSIPFRKIAF